MTESEFRHLLEIEAFPPLPGVTSEILKVTKELGAPIKAIAKLLQADPPLLNKILTVINAPFYQFTEPISEIEQALSILGYRKVSSLAVGLSLLDQFPPEQAHGFDYRGFWERSLATAIAAGEITTHLHENMLEEPFAVGLMQDVGTLPLVRYNAFKYGQAIGLARGMGTHIVHGEREVLGIDHATAGAILCKYWNLSAQFAEIVEHQHYSEFNADVAVDLKETIQVANLSNLMTDSLYKSDSESQREILYERAQTFFFRFSRSLVDEILEKIPNHLKKIAPVFSLDVGRTDEAEAPAAEEYHEKCPECGADGSSKFCAECGAPLGVTPELPALSSSKVLIVEDSSATRLALSILIRKLGYDPLEASNGVDAVRLARKELPGMVLMDMIMPAMNGLEALRKIRERRTTSHIPVVMLTSITNAETVLESLQAGANDYVVKPFTAATVHDRVKKYMATA